MHPSSLPPPAYPQQGEVLDGKYRIDHLLGEGGMGAVAKAQHLLRRAPVALKFMSPYVMAMPGAVERFLNEGVAASQIDSDHVVKVYDVGRLPSGAPYLVMEYLDGQDLAQLLAAEAPGGMSVPRAMHFVLQVLRALQVAHAAGIIHRDMKPSNCFVLNRDGEADFVKVVDFGISKVQHEGGASLTQTNSALGTPLYMAPEQARSARTVDLRTDLYSVGVMLYELLTGRTPFTSESGEFTELLFKIFTTEPPPIQSLRPELPDGLAAAVHRALARDPDARYSSAAAMADVLAPWADDRSAQVLLRLRGGAGRPSVPWSAVVSVSGRQLTDPTEAARHLVVGPTATPTRDSRVALVVAAPGPMSAPAASARSIGTTGTSAGAAAATTGLSASRDTHAPRARRSPLVYVVPVISLVALALITLLTVARMRPGPPAPTPTREPIAAPADTPLQPTDTAPSPPSPGPSPFVPAAVPSVATSASASLDVTRAPARRPPAHGRTAASAEPAAEGSGRLRLKDVKPID